MTYDFHCPEKGSSEFVVTHDEEEFNFLVNQVGITKKTYVITSQIKDILEKTEKKEWYCKKLIEFHKTKDEKIIATSIDDFYQVAVEYMKIRNIDYENFINRKKITANTIFVDVDEIEKLFILTIILKFYMPFYASDNRIEHYKHKKICDVIIKKLEAGDLMIKIYDLVTAKIFKCSRDDHFFLQLIKLRSSVSEETFALSTFNFLTSSILIAFDLERNPVTFISTSVGEMTKWFLKALYSETTVYKETSVILSNYVSLDVSHKIIYDDVLLRIHAYVRERLREEGVQLYDFENIIKENSAENGFMKIFVIPLTSLLLNVPINVLLDLEHSKKYELQIFLYFIIKDIIPAVKEEEVGKTYLQEILRQIIKNTKSSIYKPKNLDMIFSSQCDYFGIEHKTYLHTLVSSVMSTLSKAEFVPLFGGVVDLKQKDFIEVEKEIIPIIQTMLTEEESPMVQSFKKYVESELLSVEI